MDVSKLLGSRAVQYAYRCTIMLLVGFGSQTALADPADLNLNKLFFDLMASNGLHCKTIINQKQSEKLELLVDQPVVLSHIKDLQTINILNPEKPEEFFEQRPVTLAMTLLTSLASTCVRTEYQSHPDMKLLSVEGVLKSTDDYGNDKSTVLFTFDFPEDTFKKINWSQFYFANLPKIARHFVFVPEATALMREEAKNASAFQ